MPDTNKKSQVAAASDPTRVSLTEPPVTLLVLDLVPDSNFNWFFQSQAEVKMFYKSCILFRVTLLRSVELKNSISRVEIII